MRWSGVLGSALGAAPSRTLRWWGATAALHIGFSSRPQLVRGGLGRGFPARSGALPIPLLV